jgi:hypothetical protein
LTTTKQTLLSQEIDSLRPLAWPPLGGLEAPVLNLLELLLKDLTQGLRHIFPCLQETILPMQTISVKQLLPLQDQPT